MLRKNVVLREVIPNSFCHIALFGMAAEDLLDRFLHCPSSSTERKTDLLEGLIQLSRSPAQRHACAGLDAVPRLLGFLRGALPLHRRPSLTSPELKTLHLLLKLLRNLCAGEAANQQAFVRNDGAGVISGVLLDLLARLHVADGASSDIESASLQGHISLSLDDNRRPLDRQASPDSSDGLLEVQSNVQKDQNNVQCAAEARGDPEHVSGLPDSTSQIFEIGSQREGRHPVAPFTDRVDTSGQEAAIELGFCALGPTNNTDHSVQVAGDHGAHPHVIDVCHMALQLLGNVAGGGAGEKEEIWKTFVPSVFRRLALLGEAKVLEPVSMVLYTCSDKKNERMTMLCHGEGAMLLSACLETAAATGALTGSTGDWLYLLIQDTCLKESLFPGLFKSLGHPSDATISSQRSLMSLKTFSEAQVILLDMLCHLLSEKADTQKVTSCINEQEKIRLPMPSESLYFLGDIIKLAINQVILECDQSCDIRAIDVLRNGLEVIKVVSRWENGEQQKGRNVCTEARAAVLAQLLSHGFIKLCIDLLRGLGPPELIQRAIRKSEKLDTSQNLMQPSSNENVRHERESCKEIRLPYKGFRKDLVAVIANASYQNQAVQDEVRKLGGLPLILQQCVVDEENPFLREWGLWAVRNLLDRNIENSNEISEMQLKGTFTPVELADMGLKVQMDAVKGRPKLVYSS